MNNPVVMVTGAGNGIGRAIAIAYAKIDYAVVIADMNLDAAKETAQIIKDCNGKAEAYHCDVTKESDITSLVKEVTNNYGRIDVLINNAGVSEFCSPYELSIDNWDRILNTNVRGAFLCSREVAKVMRTKKGGAIINIASTRATMSEPNSEAYAASKGAIVALTHALAASLQKGYIRVNCISPGWIHTDESERLREIDHQQHFSNRVGTPEDIARACLFLTAEGNEFVNGENLVIDGGMTRKMIYEH